MRHRLVFASLALAAFCLTAAATSADAKCTRLGFSVNDYGKEGPTRDAKAMLDKYIASWTAQNGIKSYTTGKKDVKCELYLDVGLFDEHTCRAEATVCWGGSAGASAKPVAAAAPASAPVEPRAAAVIEPTKKVPVKPVPAAKAAGPAAAASAPPAPKVKSQ
jgi:hypothetical protein